MSPKEYAELLEYINENGDCLDNVCFYRVHSSYNAKSNKIYKVTLKINYTKDNSKIPEIINGKIPKNIVQRSISFRNDECNLDNIIAWISNFMIEKS